MENPIAYLTKKMWQYSEGNRKNVVFYIFLSTLAHMCGLVEPLILAWSISIYENEGLTHQSVIKIIGVICLYIPRVIVSWSFHGLARIIERNNAFLVRANYNQYLINGIKELPAEWHAEHHSGDTIDKIGKGTSSLFEYSSKTFEVIKLIIRLVGSYIALAFFSVHSLYVVLIGVIFSLTLIVKFDKVLAGQYRELNKAQNKIAEKVFDMISNINTVIISRVEKLLANEIFRKVMEPFVLYNRNNKINELKWFLVSLCASTMTVVVVGLYLYLHLKSGLGHMVSAASIAALYGYLDRINGTFFDFAGMYGDVVRQRANVANAEELAKDFLNKPERPQANLTTGWKKLEIKSLTFSHHTEEGADLHLDDINMTINRGERIALIGESGSGKTTLLKIIRNIHTTASPKLYVDGQQVNEGFEAISDSVALIPQDPEIFATTILTNITFNIDHDPDYVRRFTDMACFTDVALGLPRGFDSSIKEKGVNLSEGQKQRLALARGLMTCENRSILLLDEPTSSIDFANEMRIHENIFREMSDKTIISSVHKLHLLPMFDTIYFFHDGKIIASGTFDELIAECPRFAEMWQKYNSQELPEVKRIKS